ncbi:CTLSE2 [Cordylochernes scorpioides]|uniref:CTLSE2 n=1 Tax=Cordylochernes scorpioides TaxID=51811 RepID=A0ABY6LFI2_9ARAC|nr:CTLSE2 [Cordylochernes scorpioides]
MQSTIMGKGVPQKAVDGSTSSFFNADTCTMTEIERAPWWYVNLLEPYLVQLVRIDFGTPCCSNNRPATIVVRVGNNRPDLNGNPICNKFTGFIEEGRPLFLPCTTAMPGAFVSIHLEGHQGNPLSICETFVYTDQALPIERCPTFRDQPLGSTATYNGKCYIFYHNQPKTFPESRRFCEMRGGSLVDETSPALQGFLSWELYRRHRNDPNGQYWMGAVRDPRNPANWKWINGQDVSISFWNLPTTHENCSRFDGAKGWLWSDTNCGVKLNFICQHRPATCGRPERPPNSTIQFRNREIGSVIEYRCAPGHLLVGPHIRSCLATGFFSEIPPKCRYLECGRPASIPHGSYTLVNSTQHYQSLVQYHCHDGYVLVGRGQLKCDVDEKWNGRPPRCDPVYCQAPPPTANGRYYLTSNSTIYGSVAEYLCDSGFTLVGNTRLLCVSNGFWNGDAPICIKPMTTSAAPTPVSTSRMMIVPPSTSPPPPPPVPVRPSPYQPHPSTGIRLVTPSAVYTPVRTSVVLTTPTTTPRPTPPPTTRRPQTYYISPSTQRPTTVYYRPPSPPASTARPPRPAVYRPSTTQPPESPIITLQTFDNEIPHDSFRKGDKPEVPRIGPKYDSKTTLPSTKLTTGGIIAMVVFGGFVVMLVVIVAVIVLIRRNRRTNGSVDSNTVTTYDGGSDHGLHRFYQQAWDNFRYDHSTQQSAHTKLSRLETLDNPNILTGMRPPKSTARTGTIEGYREANEIVVSDVAALYSRPDKSTRGSPPLPNPKDKRMHGGFYGPPQFGHSPRRY